MNGPEQGGGESLLSPAERSRMAREQKARRLAELKEQEAIDANDLGVEDLTRYVDLDVPLTRENVGNRAVVLTQAQLELLGELPIILPSGEMTFLDPDVTGLDPDEQIIFLPEDFGSTEKE